MKGQKIRVAIVGVGNCAWSLAQGVVFYRDAPSEQSIPGLMNVVIDRYHVSDIELVAAFDVTTAKVGRALSDALQAHPNDTHRFATLPQSDVVVQRGPTLDGIGRYLTDLIEESEAPVVDVAQILERERVEVLVSYLPVGSQRATEWYAEQALRAGCAFVNCIPVFIASDPVWERRFAERGLPLVGDDVKSQVGATIVHRTLARLFGERGVELNRTYQLNFGGNTDFLNMLERDRLESKKISKTRSVVSQIASELPAGDVHIGPSDHVPWLTDRKWAHIRLEGTGFGGTPLNIDLKLEVWDSPNSAGIVIDAIRCARLALDRGIGGALIGPCSYFMKSPPQQFSDAEARARTQKFQNGEE